MKTLLGTGLLLIVFQLAIAQTTPTVTSTTASSTLGTPLQTASTSSVNNPDIRGKYYWNSQTIITACNIDGSETGIASNQQFVVTKERQLFYVINQVSDSNTPTISYAILIIVSYNATLDPSDFYMYNFSGGKSEHDTIEKAMHYSRNYGKFQRYFKIKVEDLKICATPYKHIGGALAGGIINFPFKLRLQKNANDFSSAFNLGAAVGYTFPHNDYRNFTYSMLGAAAITTISLDSSSVKMNANKLTSTNNFSALSLAIGWLVQYDKFQAGVFIGMDKLGKINNDTFGWNYQNKPWISIGFGYSIFSVQKQTANTDSN